MSRLAFVLSILALTGCGGSSETAAPRPEPKPPPSAGAPIPGGGLTVQAAIDSELDGPLMVKGYLLERGGELRLCSAILESYPPQCGDPSLRVEGLGARGVPSEKQVSLLGEVRGGVFEVSETSL